MISQSIFHGPPFFHHSRERADIVPLPSPSFEWRRSYYIFFWCHYIATGIFIALYLRERKKERDKLDGVVVARLKQAFLMCVEHIHSTHVHTYNK